jgi:hypothetical protein
MQSKFFYSMMLAFCVGVGVQTVYPMKLEEVVWVLLLGFIMGVVWRQKKGGGFLGKKKI